MDEDKNTEEKITEPETTKDSPDAPANPDKPAETDPKWQRFKAWYSDRKKWTIPLSVLLVILILAAVPFTRYGLAGTVRKNNIELKVTDATANTPVSGATVSIGNLSGETDSSGMVTLHGVNAGHHNATISKKYYQPRTINVLAPIFSQKTVPEFQLTATGRQVKIEVTNLIDKTALANVDIKVAGTTAKTDKTGSAVVVLPVGEATQTATLSLPGYNDAKVTVKVSNDKIQDNPFGLTPAGKVYFLSNLSGKIDVVKTNLDGTDRQTVLAGTGSEDDRNTVLLSSRDWKYLALLSRRAGNSPTLYLINTSDDSLTTVDSSSADFNLTGWVNGSFVYTLTKNNAPPWQPGGQVLKSYNPATKSLTTLDQTSASGTNDFDYVSQQINNVYGYDGKVFYTKSWNTGGASDLTNKQATFDSVNTDGSGKAAIKSFSLVPNSSAGAVDLSTQLVTPDKFEIYFYDGAKDNFYTYSNGQVTSDKSETSENFYNGNYATYLLSPSGSQTFWSETRDGKNTLFTGDQNGQNSKQIATLSDYSPYGWYTDNYLLVSKNGSELYAMAKDGSQTPVKISDYHKPAAIFYGYGGGYGGL